MDYDDEKAVKVLNPVSEECTMLRQNLAVSLLNCLKYNCDNGQKNFWAYEIGKTYISEKPADLKSAGVKETQVLEGIISGEVENSKWQVNSQPDFYTAKGIVENLFEEFDITKRIKLVPIEDSKIAKYDSILHPYRSAAICLLGKELTTIGYVGQIHPVLKDKMKLKQEAFIFSVDLDVLISVVKENVPRFKHLPQYPEVRRDLAFVIGDKVSYDDIQRVIKSGVQQNIFKGCEVFDVYQGENIEQGYKSLAFRIKMLDENSTLTDDVIERNMQSVREKLQKAYADISFRE
jgi:phenylalanyl-tRNA synthetase beta chain